MVTTVTSLINEVGSGHVRRFREVSEWAALCVSDKKGEYDAQISPKSELFGFNWAKTHKKCVHDPV